MRYFVTGGTGFIGRNLIKHLVKRGGTIHVLVRGDNALDMSRFQELCSQCESHQLVAVKGDLSKPRLGLSDEQIESLTGQIDHFFHLAAIYDLEASAEAMEKANIDGTRNAVKAAEALQVGCFHHTSSIVAAGMYRGVFREDMFEQAENLDHPYFSTKHYSEKVVREECNVPWRVYRPGVVVGHSKTGAADRVDGPYFFFKLLQKMRNTLPQWMPTIGLEGGRLNIVPVDFVVAAMDHIAHQPDLDKRCFHLTDPKPYRVGEILNIFAAAGHAPRMTMRINTKLFEAIPGYLRSMVMQFPPVKRIVNATLSDLGIPKDALAYFNYPTEFDCRDTEQALAGSGISCPRLEHYAPAIWDYWERNLDPALFADRTLHSKLQGKKVLITGATSGIGEATAMTLARAGADLVLVARTVESLVETRERVEKLGGTASIYPCDLSDLDQLDRMVEKVTEEQGGVDILVNNAGRSIRRSIANSLDRFHDFERTMQLNYFGSIKLIMGFLPGMMEKNRGQVINISSIGVLTNAPRFSAYVASKSALDAYSRCAASEFSDQNIHFTTINMPLVRTPMIAPTKIYNSVPTLSPDQAADLVVKAILEKPKRIATRLGIFGALVHAITPKFGEIIMNTSFRMFPDSDRSKEGVDKPGEQESSTDMVALANMMRGIHL